MKPIEESIITKAPAKIVWKSWVDMYQMKSGNKNGFREGYTGHIIEKGRKVPYTHMSLARNYEVQVMRRF